METIDIFYQGLGIREIEHIEVRPDHTVREIKAILTQKHGCAADTLIFIEDRETPLDDHLVIKELCGPGGAKMHLHRCHHVEVFVAFAGKPFTTSLRPERPSLVLSIGPLSRSSG